MQPHKKSTSITFYIWGTLVRHDAYFFLNEYFKYHEIFIKQIQDHLCNTLGSLYVGSYVV